MVTIDTFWYITQGAASDEYAIQSPRFDVEK